MTLDYKVRIEGEQSSYPAVINLFSIDGRIKSVKGRYLNSDVSLYLEFDNNDQLSKVEGQQFDKKTHLRFIYDKKGRIASVIGKKGGRSFNPTVKHHPFPCFMSLTEGKPEGLLGKYNFILVSSAADKRKELEKIQNFRNDREPIYLQFNWEDNRVIERIDNESSETLNIKYEKVFSNPSTIYRNNSNTELPADIEVDTETIINYFLFIH